jgi:hypothetical protein
MVVFLCRLFLIRQAIVDWLMFGICMRLEEAGSLETIWGKGEGSAAQDWPPSAQECIAQTASASPQPHASIDTVRTSKTLVSYVW